MPDENKTGTEMADCQRCMHESKIATLEQRDTMIIEHLGKLDQKMDLILMQISKVAVLEVNQEHQSEAMGRAFGRIESVERENSALRKEVSEFIHTTRGMARMAWFMWAMMGSGLGAVLFKVLFLSHQ